MGNEDVRGSKDRNGFNVFDSRYLLCKFHERSDRIGGSTYDDVVIDYADVIARFDFHAVICA